MVREYRTSDAPAIRACIVELQDHERRIDERLRAGESMADGYYQEILDRCRKYAGTILVAERTGVVAGFAAVLSRVPFESLDDPPGEYALVSDLVVLAAFRRRGLGRALLGEAERYVKRAGATELRIGVLSANREAARLYRREGFAPYAETLAKRLDIGDREHSKSEGAMDSRAEDTRAELATFLALTFGLSAVFYALIIAAGSLGARGGLYVLALMWCPGVSALVTRLVFQHNVRGEGWRWGSTRWAALAYVLPLGYATLAYGLVWLLGLGGVDLTRFRIGVVTFLALGSLQSLLSATGEELGWRGFLVPTLARTMSFGRTALVSGAIWAAWHVPLIVFADYNAGTPTWYSVLCFAVMVIALGVPFAWLRLRSGSVWPAAILHASHNLFVQGFFDRVTVDTGPTRWLTTEFGAALALAIVGTAWVFWRARGAIETRAEPEPMRSAAAPQADAVTAAR